MHFQVSKTINGPMMEILAKAMQYKDAECIDMFRMGGPLLGFLPNSGHGVPIEYTMEGSIRDLMNGKEERNRSLIAGLKEDVNSDVLLAKTLDDAKLGRMSMPSRIGEIDLDEVILSPRFAVEQGAPSFVCWSINLLVSCACFYRYR